MKMVMVEIHRLQAKNYLLCRDATLPSGAHTKTALKVHLVWIPKYHKRVLNGPVSVRARDIIRQIAMEHELSIIPGKVAVDHVHLFISYRPTQSIRIVHEITSRFCAQIYAKLKCSD